MLKPGMELNKTYRVERLLGEGGMASVFEVSHLRFSKRFALKIITARYDQDPQFRARFKREAELLGSLAHPNIVSVIDWHEYEAHPYLVMELLKGEDLAQALLRGQPMSMKDGLTICRQLGEALGAAHDRGIIHRDLKPANLFLCLSESNAAIHVKVLDFGLARPISPVSSAFRTEGSWVAGTPAYMSPEQASGCQELDERTDQFSLAVICYELLSGRRLFAQPSDPIPAILYRVAHQDPPTLPWPLLDKVLRRALAKERTARYESIREFMEALLAAGRQTLTGEPATPLALSSTPQVSAAASLEVRSRPQAWPRYLAIAVAALGISAGIASHKLWLNTRAEPRHDPQAPAPLIPPEGLRGTGTVVPGPPLSPFPAVPTLPPAAAQPAAELPVVAAPIQEGAQGARGDSSLDELAASEFGQLVPHRKRAPGLRATRPPAKPAERPSGSLPQRRPSPLGQGGLLQVEDGDARQKRTIRQCFEKSMAEELPKLPPAQLLLRGVSALRVVAVQGSFPPQYTGPLENCLRDEGKVQLLPYQVTVSIGGGAR